MAEWSILSDFSNRGVEAIPSIKIVLFSHARWDTSFITREIGFSRARPFPPNISTFLKRSFELITDTAIKKNFT